MEPSIESAIRQSLQASNEGRIHFGQVVADLVSAGVESYNVDYRAQRTTYYLPGGETLTLDTTGPVVDIAGDFSASAIKSAIMGAQRGELMYPEFKRRSQAAGCTGYTVWLAGRHVTYYGRNGETHVECFPD